MKKINPRYRKVSLFSKTKGEGSRFVWICVLPKNLDNLKTMETAVQFLSKELNLNYNSDYMIEDNGTSYQLMIKKQSFYDRERRKLATMWELDHIHELINAFIVADRYNRTRPYK